MDSLLRAKIDQAMELMKEQGIDCWIAQLGQETWLHPDPIQALVVGTTVTWPAAFLITWHWWGRATSETSSRSAPTRGSKATLRIWRHS